LGVAAVVGRMFDAIGIHPKKVPARAHRGLCLGPFETSVRLTSDLQCHRSAGATLISGELMKRVFCAFAVLIFATFAAWADPAGSYDVKGIELDGSSYHGTLEIAKSGDVYELTYTFDDGTTQSGSAVGDDSFLAYGYGDDEELGVGLMTAKGNTWEGIWTH